MVLCAFGDCVGEERRVKADSPEGFSDVRRSGPKRECFERGDGQDTDAVPTVDH